MNSRKSNSPVQLGKIFIQNEKPTKLLVLLLTRDVAKTTQYMEVVL